MQHKCFRERKPRKKRREELSLSQRICSSSRNLSRECGFAFFGCSVALCADPVLLIWPAKGKGCSSSLCRSSPYQIGTSSFPPHQCWFTSSCPHVIPQKEKHRIKWFWQSFVLVLWHMIRVGKQKSKATAPVYCEWTVLSNFSIYVPAYNTAAHMD